MDIEFEIWIAPEIFCYPILFADLSFVWLNTCVYRLLKKVGQQFSKVLIEKLQHTIISERIFEKSYPTKIKNP